MAQSKTLTYNFNFNGVDVTVYHHPRYLCSSDHVEWRSVPCSVTETGYYSMWLPEDSTADDVNNLILNSSQYFPFYNNFNRNSTVNEICIIKSKTEWQDVLKEVDNYDFYHTYDYHDLSKLKE